MAEKQERHLSLSNEDRMRLLDLLLDEDFREEVKKDPIAALATKGITFTQEDVDSLPDGVVLPSIEDLRTHRQEYEDAIIQNGAGFFIFRFWCLTPDRPE